ncbi:metal-sulfur cluster assembly factor [Limnochorda pilosa]|uniref:metal-sulfur cluster assembly factor n=1 Tax=Limnochorda pilosa TaxID=1555112 RepID=UPI000A5149A4|nr:metal-sulfur cluster assembly factor [Limnochorda pilosa]
MIDPELGLNVVDLGLIYDVHIGDGGHVEVTMTLTTPGCPLHGSMADGVREVVAMLPGVRSVDVHLVGEPPWGPERMSRDALRALGWT